MKKDNIFQEKHAIQPVCTVSSMKKRPNEEEENEKENSQDEEREREAEGEDTMEQSKSNGKEQKLRNKNHLPKGEFHAKKIPPRLN